MGVLFDYTKKLTKGDFSNYVKLLVGYLVEILRPGGAMANGHEPVVSSSLPAHSAAL